MTSASTPRATAETPQVSRGFANPQTPAAAPFTKDIFDFPDPKTTPVSTSGTRGKFKQPISIRYLIMVGV